MLWYIIVSFLLIFQCNPIHAAWDMALKMSTAKCNSPGRLVAGIEIGIIVVDIFILLLPVYMVQQLQMKLTKKVGVIVVCVYPPPSWFLGPQLIFFSVCIACIIRAYYSWEVDTGSPRKCTTSISPTWGLD